MGLAQRRLLTEDDYLAFEAQAIERHEFVGGEVHAMDGTSVRHNRIAGNMARRLDAAADGTPCMVLMSDVKLRLDSGNIYYYPDLMLACDPTDNDPYARARPCLTVEVASPRTANIDRREKWAAYQGIQTLREYLIVDQDEIRIELRRRENLRDWSLSTFEAGEVLELACLPGFSIAVDDIYRDLPPVEGKA
jgi:Uma2 family endonuclease